MSKKYTLRMHILLQNRELVLLSYSEDSATFVITMLRKIVAGPPLHSVQEEGEQELDQSAEYSPHHTRNDVVHLTSQTVAHTHFTEE